LHDYLAAKLAAQLLGEEQTTLRAERAAMQKKQNILSDTVKDVHLALPRVGQITRSPVPVRIEIAGVGPAFATPQPDLPDRLMVFLNDQRLPLGLFELKILGRTKGRVTGISLTLPNGSPDVVEGINTLTVSVVDGNGTEHRTTNAFIVEADLESKERPIKERPIPHIDRPGKTLHPPKKQPGAAVGHRSKREMNARVRQQMSTEPLDPIANIAALSGKLADMAQHRFRGRHFQEVQEPKVVESERRELEGLRPVLKGK
jgi:hypothetical protein